MSTRYHGSYMHWLGALLHISDKSRWDINYLTIQLSGCNSWPKTVCCKILYQWMCYLFHHPLVSIIYIFAFIHHMIFPNWSFTKYISTEEPCNFLIASIIALVWRNAPGMLYIAASLPSLAIMAFVMKINSVAAVGGNLSDLFVHRSCGRIPT